MFRNHYRGDLTAHLYCVVVRFLTHYQVVHPVLNSQEPDVIPALMQIQLLILYGIRMSHLSARVIKLRGISCCIES